MYAEYSFPKEKATCEFYQLKPQEVRELNSWWGSQAHLPDVSNLDAKLVDVVEKSESCS
jgi:hypothetical protein